MKKKGRVLFRTVTFEDHGQDFLRWTVDSKGVVTECGPFQGWLWVGTKVHNRTIKSGDVLRITCIDGERRELLYPVRTVAEVRG